MKIKTILITLITALLLAPNTFAANPYGIVYEGGEPLGENNVQIAPEMIDGLTNLNSNSIVEYPDTSILRTMYRMRSGNCVENEFKGLAFGKNYTSVGTGEYDFKIVNNENKILVKISNIFVDDSLDALGDNKISLRLNNNSGSISINNIQYYTDSDCSEKYNTYTSLSSNDGIYVYVRLRIRLLNEHDQPIISDELYYLLQDIDAAQSFRILNSDNVLTTNNMFAVSANALQPTSGPDKNMFVVDGNYIYSQGQFDIPTGANIYVKINQKSQSDGLDIVHGYGTAAASAPMFFAKQYSVKYISDKYGEIASKPDDYILSGDYPSRISTKPSSGYELKYWTADKDVTLSDGTVIKAGKKILPSELTKVIVHSDLTFTAIHGLPEEDPEPIIPAPNSGAFTGETNASQAIFPIAGTLLGALLISVAHHFSRKKSIKID